MIETSLKNPQSYLATYQKLLTAANSLKPSPVNTGQSDTVHIQHTDTNSGEFEMMAQLNLASVTAKFTPEAYSNYPKSTISFVPEGEILHVTEKSQTDTESVERIFDIDSASTFQNIQQMSIPVTPAKPMDDNTRGQVLSLMYDTAQFGFTIHQEF